MTLGKRVREARQALGLRQIDVATPGFSKSLISLIESDRTMPSVPTLTILAERLKRPLAYFLEDNEGALAQKTIRVLESQGRAELVRRQYENALATFTEMHGITSLSGDARSDATAVLGIGEVLLGQRRLDEARGHLQDALDRGRAMNDRLIECRALHGLATVEHRLSRFVQAATLYRAALAVIPALEGREPLLHGEIWFFLGTVLHRVGRLEESWEALERAQRIFEESARPERVGEVLMTRGVVSRKSGDFDGAILQYERARVLCEQYEDLQTLSHVRNNLGVAMLSAGRPREALEHLLASLTIKERLGDGVGECHALTEIARCYLALDESAQAHAYAERALARSREATVPDEAARAHMVLGAVAAAAGDIEKAQRYLTLAVNHCEDASMMMELVTVSLQLALLASSQGDHEQAVAHHARALAAIRTTAPRDLYMEDLLRVMPQPVASIKSPSPTDTQLGNK